MIIVQRISIPAFHFRLVSWLIAGVLLSGGVKATGAEQTRTAHGFALEIPEAWHTIPAQALSEYSEGVTRLSGGAVKEVYHAGYQRDTNEGWFVHPYILVQVKETGRVPERQLKNLKPFQQGAERGFDKVMKSLDSTISDAQLGDTLYDATNRCLWMRMSANVEGVGPIKGITCSFLTEKGFILFHGYDKATDFDRLRPLFERTMASVAIDDGLKYTPKAGDSLGIDFGSVGRNALIGGLVGGLVGVGAWIANRIKARPPKLPPPV